MRNIIIMYVDFMYMMRACYMNGHSMLLAAYYVLYMHAYKCKRTERRPLIKKKCATGMSAKKMKKKHILMLCGAYKDEFTYYLFFAINVHIYMVRIAVALL